MPDGFPPFAPSPECLAAASATPEAERRHRRDAWLSTSLLALFGLILALVAGLLAAVLFLPPALAVSWWAFRRQGAVFRRRRFLWRQPFPAGDEEFLLAEVPHFRRLDDPGRELFRQRAKMLLDETVFHGAGIKVDDELRLLASAAGVIPTLGFPEWHWPKLREIIFRPQGYDDGSAQSDAGVVSEFEESGLVGLSGVLNGVMMLSAADLIWEFAHPEEGYNVGFHEFAHLMVSDGGLALSRRDRGGWERLLDRERRRIENGDSLLDDYALVDEGELFALASELFFTMPHRFRLWHRELYAVLSRAYRQNPCLWLEDCGPPEEPPRRRRRRRKRRDD